MKSKLVIFVLTLTIQWTSSQACGTPKWLEIPYEWEQVFQSDNAEYEYRTAALGSRDDGIWVLIGSRLKGSLSGPLSFLLCHVDRGGRTTRRLDLDVTLRKVNSDARYTIFGIATLDNSRLGVIARFEAHGTFLVVLDNRTGELLHAGRIERDKDLFLMKILRASDDALLLAGRSGADGWVGMVDESGKIIWERRMNTAGIAVVMDAVPTDDGTFILLASSNSKASQPATWIARINAKGETISENRFAGYVGSVAVSSQGTSIVIGERSVPGGKDIWTQLLTRSLEQKQSATLLAGVKSVFPFKAAPTPGEGWIVIGSSSDYLPWFGFITRDGEIGRKETGRYDPEKIPIMGRADVLSDSSGIYALFTLAILNEKKEQQQTVRVVRLRPR